MLTIARSKGLTGFVQYDVMHDDVIVVTFELYTDAVEFIRMMEEI